MKNKLEKVFEIEILIGKLLARFYFPIFTYL